MKRSDYAIDFAGIRSIDKDPSNTYWHVMERIAFMHWPTDDADLRQALAVAPEGVRLFHLISTFEGPVEDGGFGQYFASRRPTWLHEMAKSAIAEIGGSQVVAIINEAEQYLERHRDRLYEGIPREEWVKVMGVVPMNNALDNIHARFFRACKPLHQAKEKYLNKHQDRFE